MKAANKKSNSNLKASTSKPCRSVDNKKKKGQVSAKKVRAQRPKDDKDKEKEPKSISANEPSWMGMGPELPEGTAKGTKSDNKVMLAPKPPERRKSNNKKWNSAPPTGRKKASRISIGLAQLDGKPRPKGTSKLISREVNQNKVVSADKPEPIKGLSKEGKEGSVTCEEKTGGSRDKFAEADKKDNTQHSSTNENAGAGQFLSSEHTNLLGSSMWTELLHSAENIKKSAPTSVDKTAAREWAMNVLRLGVDGLVAEFKPGKVEFAPDQIKGYLANSDMNRYNKQYCLDCTRVKMPPPMEYFHANYVSTPPSKKLFICCQAPMTSTCEAFWKMIVHHEVEIIMMLCEFSERNVEKCANYFPMKSGESKSFNDISIDFIGTFELDKTTPAKVTVTSCEVKVKNRKPLMVHHYQWRQWPDHGVPTAFLAPIQLLTHAVKSSHPILVHCSAGIGRTGTLILIWALIDQIKNPKNAETGPQLLNRIRAQRAHSVQNELQYLFAYRCVLECLVDREIITKAEIEKFHSDYETYIVESKKKRKREAEDRNSTPKPEVSK